MADVGGTGTDPDIAYLYDLDYQTLKAMVLGRKPTGLYAYAERWREVSATYQTKVEFLRARIPDMVKIWDSAGGRSYTDRLSTIAKAMDHGQEVAYHNSLAWIGAADALETAQAQLNRLDAVQPPPASSSSGGAPGPTPAPSPAPAPTRATGAGMAGMTRDQFNEWRRGKAASIAADLSSAYLLAMTELRDMPPFDPNPASTGSPPPTGAGNGGYPTSRPPNNRPRPSRTPPSSGRTPDAPASSSAPRPLRSGGGTPIPPPISGAPGIPPPGVAPGGPPSKTNPRTPGVIGNRPRPTATHGPVGRTIGMTPPGSVGAPGSAPTPVPDKAPGQPSRTGTSPGFARPGASPPLTAPSAPPPGAPPTGAAVPPNTTGAAVPPDDPDQSRAAVRRTGLRGHPADFRPNHRTVGPVLQPAQPGPVEAGPHIGATRPAKAVQAEPAEPEEAAASQQEQRSALSPALKVQIDDPAETHTTGRHANQ